ncbi:uncharacterized protein ACRADG_002656 isoform 2-T2 [Cochliomyia hominivorax]
MDQYNREGLNYVPLLTQNNSPPCSSRSRLSLNKNKSQRSLIYYNGNYEGDNSMFQSLELERLSLVDTESDTEFQNYITTSRSTLKEEVDNESTSFAGRLLKLCMMRLLNPEWREKTSINIEKFQKTDCYRKSAECLKFLFIVWTYVLFLTQHLCYRLLTLGHFFWRNRVIFRNLVRRLLWWLTLAKCSDLYLFLLILISSLLLFILSFLGLIITLCGELKDALCQGVYLMKYLLKKFN